MIFLLYIFLPWVFANESPVQMDYTTLEQIIRDNNVRSVDQLLPLLPIEFRSNYTFIYQSRSAQRELTSPDFPRALLYTRDPRGNSNFDLGSRSAKFVLTFTRAPENATEGTDRIETMQWNEETSGFEFRELVFDGESNPLARPIETNPSSCLSCHGNPPRPNWDTYNLWPGVYGSFSAGGCGGASKNSREAQYYESFMRNGRQGPRFRDLPVESQQHQFIGKIEDCFPDSVPIGNALPNSDPNAELTEAFHTLNLRRIKKMITSSTLYPAYRYTLAAVANGCYTQNGYLRELLRNRAGTVENLNQVASLSDRMALGVPAEQLAGINEQLESVSAQFLQDQEATIMRFTQHHPSMSTSSNYGEVDQITQVTWLFRAMGIPWDRITLPFTDGTYNFDSPGAGVIDLYDMIVKIEGPNSELSRMSCTDLSSRSLASLSEQTTSSCVPKASVSPTLTNLAEASIEISQSASLDATINSLQVCMQCHGNGLSSGGFSLAAGSALELGQDLRENPSKLELIRDHLRGVQEDGTSVVRMPLGRPPFDESTQSMILNDLLRLRNNQD